MTRASASTCLADASRRLAWFGIAAVSACAQAPAPKPGLDVGRYHAMIVDARTLIDQKQPAEAIAKDLEPVIEAYDAAYATSTIAYYSVRTPAEATVYLLMASLPPGAGRPDVPGGPSAIALDQTWSGALYLKAFALIDLHRFTAAREPLERAVRLAPSNSQYLSELGELHAVGKDWTRALEYFGRAEKGAELSPPEVKTRELTRALRGTAYADVELGRFDDAQALYERCLVLDPQDVKAASELGYVRQQQARQISRGPASR